MSGQEDKEQDKAEEILVVENKSTPEPVKLDTKTIDSLNPEQKEKLQRAIAAGAAISGVLIFDHLLADEWFVKNEKDEFELKRKTIIQEIFE